MASDLSVLLLESDPGAADAVAADLIAEGMRVERCHEGGEAFPCRALHGSEAGTCPVEAGTVDVAVTVRAQPRSNPTATEDGVTCAIRRHIPVVVAGRTALHPFEPWATEVVDSTEGIAEVVRAAAAAALPRHGEVAKHAADEVIHRHGHDRVFTDVVVRRRHDGLQVVVTPTEPVGRKTQAMVGVRVVGAIREIDATTREIDISFA